MAAARYQEIKQMLLDSIKDMPVNSSIASERELALRFQVSRMTIRKVINLLVEEGILYRNKNKGTFVADRSLTKRNTALDSFVKQEEDFNVVHFNIKEMPEIAKIFQVSKTEQILRVVRINRSKKKPISVEELFFVFKDVEKEYLKALDKLLNVNSYLKDGKMIQRFYPMILPVKYANLLELKIGTPIIMVESTIYNRDQKICLLVHTYHNPEKHTIEIIS